ncbi:hypothetical protein EJ02DRAFT_213335 [Clathrospora elynae]|uniref:Spo12-like protein n=1 Tax=Clathrospora elynae TaxID=706981 RepID=A0A6A5SJW4_9PLEO|nr:hypothetical protein EJ02DRAFT_213335 [Clathrospora elynae]
MASNILSARDTNMQVKPISSPEKEAEKSKSLDYHRQVLQSRMNSEQEQKFVSPSDDIMSPATQKLAAFKTKHSTKKSKPQTLFKKTSAKNYETSKGTAMFADIPKKDQSKEEGV